jgi:hypothetical protein
MYELALKGDIPGRRFQKAEKRPEKRRIAEFRNELVDAIVTNRYASDQ